MIHMSYYLSFQLLTHLRPVRSRHPLPDEPLHLPAACAQVPEPSLRRRVHELLLPPLGPPRQHRQVRRHEGLVRCRVEVGRATEAVLVVRTRKL